MNYAEYKPRYDEDGFVVVRGFLPSSELQELNREVDRFIRDVAPHLPEDQAFYHQRPDGTRALRQLHRMNCDPFFESYRSNLRWHDLAFALVGEPVKANPPLWVNKPACTNHATPPHQDNRYYCLTPPNFVMILVALQPMTRENGCLHYVRASHKQGPRPHGISGVLGFSQGLTDCGPDDIAGEVAVELQAGDAVCHHAETVHWANANQSKTLSRPGLAMTWVGESCRLDREAQERYEKDAERRDILK